MELPVTLMHSRPNDPESSSAPKERPNNIETNDAEVKPIDHNLISFDTSW